MDEGARPQAERLLRPAEVAALLRVDPDTVGRWAANGLIPSIRTPGGRRRYRESDIMALFEEPYDAPRRTRGSYGEQQADKPRVIDLTEAEKAQQQPAAPQQQPNPATSRQQPSASGQQGAPAQKQPAPPSQQSAGGHRPRPR